MRRLLLLLCLPLAVAAHSPAAAAGGQQRLYVPLSAREGSAVPTSVAWVRRDAGVTDDLRGVAAASERVAWAVGINGRIVATRDGGVTWRSQSVDGVYLQAAAAGSEQVAWAVGSGGAILATVDGEATWRRQATGTTETLRAAAAVSTTAAWAVGDAGTILATTDGGATWHAQSSGTSRPLLGLAAATPTRLWTVGEDGLVLASEDAGATWATRVAPLPPPPPGGPLTARRFYAVAAASPTVGWAVGTDDTDPGPDGVPVGPMDTAVVYATRDGGATWQPQSPTIPVPLYAVAAASPTVAWTGGFAHELIGTTDGGATWSAVGGGTLATYEGMAARDGVVWAVGEAGMIRTSSSGR